MCRICRKRVRTNAMLSQLHNTLINQVLNNMSQSNALIYSMFGALMIGAVTLQKYPKICFIILLYIPGIN